MFVSHAQFHVFCACVAFGGLFGVLFLFSKPIKNVYIKAIIDVIIFSLFTIAFSIYSYNMQFGNFRFYMVFGALLGLLLCEFSINAVLSSLIIYIWKKLKKEIYYDRRKKNKG